MLRPAPPALPQSSRSVPSSARAQGSSATKSSAGGGDHRPMINESSRTVISARARREQLLAYHVAVRLLEDAGIRQQKQTDSLGASPRTLTEEQREIGDFFDSTTSTPLNHQKKLFLDSKLLRVQQAVESFEQDHNRYLHDTIALDFVDSAGNLLVAHSTPATSPRSTATAGIPKWQPQGKGGALPDKLTMSKVEGIFQSGGFSYFDDKRKELRKDRVPDATQGGALPPCTTQGLDRMRQSGQHNRPDHSPASLGKNTPSTLTFPKLQVEFLGSGMVHPDEISFNQPQTSPEEVEENARTRHQRVAMCIREAVAAHMAATAGGANRYRRKRHSEAFQMGQSSSLLGSSRLSPSRRSNPSHHAGEHPPEVEGDGSSEGDDDLQHHQTLEEWLTHHKGLRDAVRSTVELIVFVLTKALPLCLFGGDSVRFQQLMLEEQTMLMEAQRIKERHLQEMSMLMPTVVAPPSSHRPPTAPMSASYSALMKPLISVGQSSVALPVDETDGAEQQVVNLQLKTSQRTERSLSTLHANRLFLLIEVEQSMFGNRVSRFLDGLPPALLGSADALGSTMRGPNMMSPSRATSASSGSPRKVEKIELERERRKREAMRPPRDPLQAVASSCHYWLSLTTARLRQLPFHACRDRAAPIAIGSFLDAPASSGVVAPAAPVEHRIAPHAGVWDATPMDALLASMGSQGLAASPVLVAPGSATLKFKVPSNMKPTSAGHGGGRSASVWSHKSSDTGDDVDDDIHGGSPTKARHVTSAGTTSGGRGRPRQSTEEDNGFAHPEPTILPVVDLIAVLNDPDNYDASGGAEGDKVSYRATSGSKLQDAVGPVELRLLLEISTSYAALVQSLHGASTGTSYARFLERNRDRLMRAAADIIVGASIEYLDFVICDEDGRRGLPRTSRAARAKQEELAAKEAILGEVTGARKVTEEPWRGLLASLRPFGKKVELTKAQVDAVLAASGQNALSGGIVVGNEHDAKRAASHLVEQNRAVLHEVLSRVKGELLFLLTGVDGRNRILEEEQIAVEKQQSERKATRKLRTTSNPTNAPSSPSAPHDGHHAPHHQSHGVPAIFAARGSMKLVLKGSDIVGHTNMSRFHAMINELVGSSSEEEEIRQENAYEASDVLRPVFDWQRQNYSKDKKQRLRRHHGQPRDAPSKPTANSSGAGGDGAKKPSPETQVLTASQPKAKPPAHAAHTNAEKAPPPHSAVGGLPAPLSDIDLQVPWATEEVITPRPNSTKTATRLQITMPAAITSPIASHLTPTAASSSRAKVVMTRLAQRQTSLEASTLDDGQGNAFNVRVLSPRSMSPKIVSPRAPSPRAGGNPGGSGAFPETAPTSRAARSRLAIVVSPKAAQSPPSATTERTADGPSSPGSNNALRRRSSTTSMRTRTGSTVNDEATAGVLSKLSSKLGKNRQQFGGGHRGSIFGGGQGNGIAGVLALTDKAKANVKAGEGLAMSDLQRELITLERNRRRAGRGVSSTQSPREADPSQSDPTRTPPAVAFPTESVTASVVGPTAAAVVEKFKKACGGTIQHFYGAVQGEGTSWYEQGRPCAAARLQRVAAIRGVQQGRFDLTALTPIAALRLAVATTLGDMPSAGPGDNEEKRRDAPSLVYPSKPTRVAGDLVWTL